jgi:hypothetical protein
VENEIALECINAILADGRSLVILKKRRMRGEKRKKKGERLRGYTNFRSPPTATTFAANTFITAP